jgi:choline dehydrogenase-like flavoprotein
MGRPAIHWQWATQHCQVHAVQNPRVVDASIMPAISRASINLTCIMFGEHVADWMRNEAQAANRD